MKNIVKRPLRLHIGFYIAFFFAVAIFSVVLTVAHIISISLTNYILQITIIICGLTALKLLYYFTGLRLNNLYKLTCRKNSYEINIRLCGLIKTTWQLRIKRKTGIKIHVTRQVLSDLVDAIVKSSKTMSSDTQFTADTWLIKKCYFPKLKHAGIIITDVKAKYESASKLHLIIASDIAFGNKNSNKTLKKARFYHFSWTYKNIQNYISENGKEALFQSCCDLRHNPDSAAYRFQ
jgi:hypothetical protein